MWNQERCGGRWFAAGIVFCALFGPSAAAQTTFDPVIRLRSYYTNHVEVVGEDLSDSYHRLELELPVRREFRNGSFHLFVAPFVERYERERALDSEGYRGGLTLSLAPRPRSSLEITAQAVRTQEQRLLPGPDDPLLFLTPRAERNFWNSAISYNRRMGERWSWNLRAYYADFRSELLESVDGGAPPPVTEDSTRLSFGGGAYRDLSRRTSLGLLYLRERFELELGTEEINHVLALHLQHELSQKWVLDLRAGGYRRTGTTSEGTDISGSGPEGEVTLTRVFRRMELEARAASLLTTGGGLLGTSNMDLAQLTLRNSTPERWAWYVFGRLMRRDPGELSQPTVDLEAWGGMLELRVRRLVGLRFDGHWARQTGDAVLETSLYRVGVSVVAYPLGRTRLAGSEGDG